MSKGDLAVPVQIRARFSETFLAAEGLKHSGRLTAIECISSLRQHGALAAAT
jgi:hypothetical protein